MVIAVNTIPYGVFDCSCVFAKIPFGIVIFTCFVSSVAPVPLQASQASYLIPTPPQSSQPFPEQELHLPPFPTATP